MTTLATFPVIQRPWMGYTDPGLPVGMWISQGTITGDVSGGAMQISHTFKEEEEPLGARFYNIEQVEVHTTSEGVQDAGMTFENLDIVGSTGLVSRLVHIELETDGITNAGIVSGDLKLPIFLGRPQLVGLPASVDVRRDNVDGQTLFSTVQGYIWEPRSLLVEGGLRRPLDSLYG